MTGPSGLETVAIASPLAAIAAMVPYVRSGFIARLKAHHIYWLLFAVATAFFMLETAFGARLGLFWPIASFMSLATCGWSWLLARSLFRGSDGETAWPFVVVGLIVISHGTADLLMLADGSSAWRGMLIRMLRNTGSLTSSAVLVLAAIEAVRNYSPDLPAPERRFRQIFVAGYCGLVLVAVILFNRAAQQGVEARLGDAVRICCACLALAGATLSVYVRDRLPLPASLSGRKTMRRRAAIIADDDMQGLGVRIERLIGEQVYTRNDLKVADIARLLGEPDYKVTQCITGVLGFSNFNRFINHHRISHARTALTDPAQRSTSILTIALDSGFGSIGPFNRAFKAETGQTPRDYRNARMTAQQ